MALLSGFWSYVRADDHAEGGRITKLGHDLALQFELITGDPLNLFVDQEDIFWGDRWRDEIDEAVEKGQFFVPILTPRYFQRPECRRELQAFARQASGKGVSQLLLPILYVDVATLHEANQADELVELVRAFQWEPWNDLRLAATSSERYRRGVARLAERLASAGRQAERSQMIPELPVEIPSIPDLPSDENEEPGSMDLMLGFEEALPRFSAAAEEITRAIHEISQIMTAGNEDVQQGDKQGKGFAGRVLVARRMAKELAEPSERILKLSGQFAFELEAMDKGIRVIVQEINQAVPSDPETLETICNFFAILRSLAASVVQAMASLQEMVEASKFVEGTSKDLRPPLRLLRRGLTSMQESAQVVAGWVQLLDASTIQCPDQSRQLNGGAEEGDP